MSSSIASWPAWRFLRRQVRWSVTPIPLRIFPSLLWSTQSKPFTYWSRNRLLFLEFPCFFLFSMNVGHLISDSSAFSKSSLNIWKFLVHILLKLSWRILSIISLACEISTVVSQFEHFFGIAFLWAWNENWPFPVPWQRSRGEFTCLPFPPPRGCPQSLAFSHHSLSSKSAILHFSDHFSVVTSLWLWS